MIGQMYWCLKRVFDIALSVIALPFFAVIFSFVALAIKIEDNGPVFYKAARIGKDGNRFLMYKFRSMRVNSPNIVNADGNTYNAKDDPRVTKTGRFIRETSIDEIPQIINILKGEMSVIGPRASEWDELSSYMPDEMDKLKVRPGITGYTQAYYRNSISSREKRLHDAWYANNASILLDLKIFFKTIEVVLKHDNLYTNEVGTDTKELITKGK